MDKNEPFDDDAEVYSDLSRLFELAEENTNDFRKGIKKAMEVLGLESDEEFLLAAKSKLSELLEHGRQAENRDSTFVIDPERYAKMLHLFIF